MYGGGLALFLSFSLITFGCSNASDGNGGSNESSGDIGTNVTAKTFKQVISETPKNGTLDLGTVEVNIKENDSYTINKAMTIKNGNVKGGTFIVERSGVKFENINNIKAITVDEKVGSGDFTIKGCHEIGNMWVNGGGSNSIHIGNSSISRLILNKPLVRIALEANSDGNVKIQHAIISQECKIESESGNSLENVIVANESAKVALAGTMEIKNLVSKKSESVIKEGISITISKENASLADTEIDETAINQAIEKANENLSDNTSIVKQDVPDGPKNLTLSSESCDDGILIKIANPPKATIEKAEYTMFVFIDGIGYVCQDVYNIDGNPQKEYFFPYVQKDKTYKVRIWFTYEEKDESGATISDSGKVLSWNEINVKANGGKGGDLMVVSPQEVISIDANGNFKLKAPEFAQEPNGFDWEMIVQPFEGQSWNIENSKVWKYLGEMYVPKSEINSTHNIHEYLEAVSWSSEGTIEFICIVPRIKYTRGGKEWTYRCQTVTKDGITPIKCTRQK